MANAANVSEAKGVAPSLFPGMMKVKPATLADWAAGLALVGDAVTARNGIPALVAVKDDVSGQLLNDADNNAASAGLTPSIEPDAISLGHVGPNAFEVASGDPMGARSMNSGAFMAGLLIGAVAAYAGATPGIDAAAANSVMQLSTSSGALMAKAYEVPSRFSKGSFKTRHFDTGSPVEEVQQPKSSGKDDAVGTPVPIPWASGRSLTPYLEAGWASNDGEAPAFELMTTGQYRKAGVKKAPSLRFARFSRICLFSKCSVPVTLQEVLLSSADISAVQESLAASRPEISMFERDYLNPISDLAFDPGFSDAADFAQRLSKANAKVSGYGPGMSGSRAMYVAVDEKGRTLVLMQGPASWMIPAVSKKR